MKAHARPELAAPDLIELLQLDEAGFKSRFAGTPILRTKRRGLLRNVCVALGNVGDVSALPASGKSRRGFRAVDCRARPLGNGTNSSQVSALHCLLPISWGVSEGLFIPQSPWSITGL